MNHPSMFLRLGHPFCKRPGRPCPVLLPLSVAVAAALVAVSAARAQDAEPAQQIAVTGSRVVVNGLQAPTPVTVLSSDQLTRLAPSSLADALNQLPQFQGSSSGIKSAISNPVVAVTANNLNLRNLGPVRALTLFDGLRLPPEAATGLIDANLIPQLLVDRVDIVTGGASAAYGSDAVSGVLNFVLDKKFNGLKFVAQAGEALRYNDYRSARIGVAAGGSFLGNRLHLEGSAEYYNNQGIHSLVDRPNGDANLTVVGQNGGIGGTAASPYVTVSGARSTGISFDGYFFNGPFANNSILPSGTLVPFQGTVVGSGVCVSCNTGYHDPSTISLIPKLQTDQFFGRADYKLGQDVDAFGQLIYGHSSTGLNGSTTLNRAGAAQLTIFNGNAFLPAALSSQIPAAGVIFTRQSRDLGIVTNDTQVKTVGALAGLKGKLLGRWNWDLDFSYGRSQQDIAMQQVNNVRLRAALDAVRDPASGNIVCRVALTNPGVYPGCVPINLFGEGSPSAAAVAYVQGVSTQQSVFTQRAIDANVRGELADGWAGRITGAAGFSWRDQSFGQTSNSDPAVPFVSTGIRGFSGLQNVTANFGTGGGSQTVSEGYAEVLVPLVKNLPLAKALDLNAAVRATHYSTSGDVNTWKAGLSWLPVDDLRVRATQSRDIRAATLVELYQGVQPSQQIVADPHTGANLGYLQLQSGNPALKPEKADTATFGLIFKPRALPGLSASVDFYQIDIKGAIAQPYTVSQILQLCENSNGTDPICGLINRPLPFSDRTVANFPTSISTVPLNVAAIKTRGIDLEASYGADLGGGRFALRGLASYLMKYTQQQAEGFAVTDYTGTLDLSGGLPRLRGLLSASYTQGALRIGLDEQVVGRVQRSRSTFYVDNNVPAVYYTHLNAAWRLPIMGGEDEIELFCNIANLFDRKPPVLASTNPGLVYPTARGLYDVVGRAITVGARKTF